MVDGLSFEPDRFYDETELRQLGGAFSAWALKKARDTGQLQFKEPCRGTRLYLGRWLTEWLSKPEGVK